MSRIFEAKDLSQLRYALRMHALTQEEIKHIFWTCEAMWWYEEPADPARIHVELRNGDHSNFFVNCMDSLKESAVLTALGEQCIIGCQEFANQMTPDDWVIGAAHAGTPISLEVARLLGCRHATVEKDGKGNPTVFNRHEIAEGEKALAVNDLLSHEDGSTFMSKVAVETACPGVVFLPVAMHLVNRSGKSALADGTPVRSLFDFAPVSWPATECPLCAAGSRAKKFKANKAEFFAQVA